jgi:bifunctional non-homologous end joining protein LigD
MADADLLAKYNAKRDFTKTAEPSGKAAKAAGSSFMVQKHDATRLHWDFRLELDGVLKSWAVTRGPSPNPEDKRLAVRTEDHPLSYATFEGTIPKGQYGGGTVMLWDRGTWTPHPGKDPRKTLAEGHLHFTLDGERMKGEWIMIRLKPRGKEKSENWLLRKVADQFSAAGDDLVEKCLTSVATGRTMAEIAAGKPAETPSKASSSKASSSSPRKRGSIQGTASNEKLASGTDSRPRGTYGRKGKAAAPIPPFRDLQLATLVDTVPTGSEWIHEVKYDGYRALLTIGGGKAKAYTRSGQDWSDKFGAIVSAATTLDVSSAVIDGEVVALDSAGRPSFQALQNTLKDGGTLAYFAFDLLEQDGEDLTALPNVERKRRLSALLDGVDGPIRYADHVAGAGEKLFAALCGQGYEGIVSKKADAPYRGRRTQAWLKIKCIHRQEFVIVGWSGSDKGRAFRSLLIGLHGDDGALRYAGRVGTGFSAKTLEDVGEKLARLARDKPALAVPRASARGVHWVEPELVAEIAFAEFTGDGVLRHPSFLGLREDKPAAQVVAEKPKPAPKPREGGDYFGIKITSPDRLIYPEARISKAQLADYYAQMAEPFLRWTARRPITLVRCPQGRAKQCFFQKHDAGSFGDTVSKVPVTEKDGSIEEYLYLTDAKSILACVQMGTIEFHGWGSTIDPLEKPDRLVFDLDPDEGLDFGDVKNAAKRLKELMGDLGLVSFAMLSGGKGIHVIVPLDQTRDWPAVKDFASRFSKALGQADPAHFTANMKKVERKGRIFLDWLRNQRGATAVMPWSARSRPNGPVAVPISWDELDGFDTPAAFTVLDGDALLERANSEALAGWGVADQALPDY